MKVLLIDLESDSLEPTKIHCIAYKWHKQGDVKILSDSADVDGQLRDIQHLINEADRVVGHNSCSFDFPVIQKLLGIEVPWDKQFDTFPLCQLLCPQVAEKSMKISMPNDLKGSHSLKAWGFRLKIYKGDFYGPWETISQEMLDYCKQDIRTLEAIYDWYLSKNYPEKAVSSEMELAPIINEMVRHGFKFDFQKAEELYVELMDKRFIMKDELRKVFKPRFVSGGEFIPKSATNNYTPGCPLTRIEYEEFNPSSRPQIIDRLVKLYGWKPRSFTEKGNPSIDEDVLTELPYPEAKILDTYFTIQKRLGQLMEGKQGWMKATDDTGRIHGKYMQSGTLTGRATHFGPNISQVPSNRLLYGPECRKLFTCDSDKVLVGVDMSGLELRCFAGYIKQYDHGAAVQSILHGTKENKDDIYSLAATAVNRPRDVGKTLVLAMLYGAANAKLGWTIDPLLSEDAARAKGREVRENITTTIEGFEQLDKAVKAKLKVNGYVSGLDDRKLVPRSDHAALNTLLQSAGAVLSKRWVILLYHALVKENIKFGFSAYVHDELVIETSPDIAEKVAEIAISNIKLAGEYYKFPCPLDGEWKIGRNWHDIH